jgi:hypothetical protein
MYEYDYNSTYVINYFQNIKAHKNMQQFVETLVFLLSRKREVSKRIFINSSRIINMKNLNGVAT